MRPGLLVLLLAGCSSKATAPLDLAAPVPDLSPPLCTLTFSGAESGVFRCGLRFCRSATSDGFELWSSLNGLFDGWLAVDGAFKPGTTYGDSDLSTFLLQARFDFARLYVASGQVPGSTVAVTFADIEPFNALSCASGNATVHGSARVTLIEQLDADAGTGPPGQATLVASF